VGPQLKRPHNAVFLIAGPSKPTAWLATSLVEKQPRDGARRRESGSRNFSAEKYLWPERRNISQSDSESGPRVLNRFRAKRRNIFSNSWERPRGPATQVLSYRARDA